MRTVICTLFCLVFILALLQSPEALYYDFEDDSQQDDWEALRGTWEVKEGQYFETAAADGPLTTAVGEAEWTDYTISVKAMGLVADADWGIAFRIQDANNHYSWQFVNGGLMFVSYVGGSRTETNLQGQGEILNEWQDFMVVVEGSTFELYWNGDLISTFEHDAFEAGRIGLFGWVNGGSPVAGPGGGIVFDDFIAEGPGIPSTLSVEPGSKLTVSWGKIKQTF